MFEIRQDEQHYAKLLDISSKKRNRYGNEIELIPKQKKQISLNINYENNISTNPNRGKQHGFHFTTENCIGCHACESACSEKNNLPTHFAFRSVGYIESGTFPEFNRMNISMACNHCDNPICLKGCPTRAYTKHPEYGAVIQDPEICFGCGYCTWVCPYNAPQLDPLKGQVEKCNMCIDRLELELKPACVSACVGNALDFGIIENIPPNRNQIENIIPSFPDPNITQPNIRFQQKNNMGNDITRTDSLPIKYNKNKKGEYQTAVDDKEGHEKHWNINRLSSTENPLVAFTLLVQTGLGIFFILTINNWLKISQIIEIINSSFYIPTILISILLIIFGLLMSVKHLGKPFRFYRGFNNWRHSSVSREGIGISCFLNFSIIHIMTIIYPHIPKFIFESSINFQQQVAKLAMPTAVLTIISGLLGLYYMYKCYRIEARPFWNHQNTATHFIGNTINLGSVLISIICIPIIHYNDFNWQSLIHHLMIISFFGIVIEAYGLLKHAIELNKSNHEGNISYYIQKTTFGKIYTLRNIIIIINIIISGSIAIAPIDFYTQTILYFILILNTLFTAIIGRILFYILVIPTTMPGAFFWKNKGFIEHAKDIGLYNIANTGIIANQH